MIRSSLYGLATRHPPTTTVIAPIVRPAAAVLSGKLVSGGRSFATNPKRRENDELYNKNYSDEFDESDALEVGKKQTIYPKGTPEQRSSKDVGRYSGYSGPIFRPLFGGFDDIFSRDPFFVRDPFAPMFSRRDRDPFAHIMPVLRNFAFDNKNKTILRSSPGYEIKESDGNYEIAIDVPEGVDASDMTVELEDDGTVLHLSGERKSEEDDGRVISQMRFDKRFTIGTNVDADNIKANLDEGVLVLTAPKLKPEAIEKPRKTIPITKKPHVMMDEEIIQTNYSDAFDESDWAETGKIGHEKA
jgi:HSP20 family protein